MPHLGPNSVIEGDLDEVLEETGNVAQLEEGQLPIQLPLFYVQILASRVP